jgi:hypothetical protein
MGAAWLSLTRDIPQMVTALRTAIAIEYKLDKELTS